MPWRSGSMPYISPTCRNGDGGLDSFDTGSRAFPPFVFVAHAPRVTQAWGNLLAVFCFPALEIIQGNFCRKGEKSGRTGCRSGIGAYGARDRFVVTVRLGRRVRAGALCSADIISRPRDCERYCLRFVVVSTYRSWYTRSWPASSRIMVSLSLLPSYSSILAMDSVSWA